MNDGTVEGSFRDPSGFIFHRSGVLFRQVNQSYQDTYDRLISSDLYRELTDKRLLVPHIEVEEPPYREDLAYKVIKPEPIQFISYPYEWCFSQLKDAALLTLEIQKLAMQHGMSLKDASAFNVVFVGCRPVFIDTLSFESYTPGRPWIAYRQFCQHFLAPLALVSAKDLRLNRLLSLFLDGIPLDLASKLLPWKSRLKMSILTHIHLHSKAQRRYQTKDQKSEPKGGVSKMGLLGILDSLESSLKGMSFTKEETAWGDYYDATNYSQEAFENKIRAVEEFIDIVSPQTVWDLGANTGVFSKISAKRGIQTLSADGDPVAVERLYQECKKDGEKNILPLIMDLTNASAAIGWVNRERMSFSERGPADMVLALALIHHLAIGNNVPMEGIVRFFRQLCRFLIIEFVPKQDSQVKRMLSSREDIFDHYSAETFEREFLRDFKILKSVEIKGTSRTLYLMQNLQLGSR